MPNQLSTVKIRDVNVRVHRGGDGDTVLFLHGASGVPAWLPFFDNLATRHQVIVPEHPGFDGSDDPEWIRTVSDLSYFYLEFVEQQGLDRVHLIGSALGGWIAAEVLIRDRARFQSCTLISPAGIRVEGVPAGDDFIWSPEERVRNLYYNQAFAEQQLAQSPTDEQTDTQLRNLFTVAKLAWQPRWYNPELVNWLPRIRIPALVIWGDDDKLMPPAYAALWQERLPHSQLNRIGQCGHLPHIEKSNEVARMIEHFIKGVQ